MRIPRKVRITARTSYTVKYKKQLTGRYGECDPEAKEIILRDKLSSRLRAQTFIHELIHAIEFETGLKIPHKLIHDLEAPILRVLKLNGWVK